MSDAATPLNAQQREQIKEWLHRKDVLRCKVCNLSNFAPPTMMMTLGGETGQAEHNVFMVPLSCPFCGNTALFNAQTMGLM